MSKEGTPPPSPSDTMWGAQKGIETPPLPEKEPWTDRKKICKSVEREENHEKGPSWSSARNQMGNPE
jgi:hypothetical protein